MNIQQALSSGRRFRRPHMLLWWEERYTADYNLSGEDILANDWEIEEEIREVSRSEIEKLLELIPGTVMSAVEKKDCLINLGFAGGLGGEI